MTQPGVLVLPCTVQVLDHDDNPIVKTEVLEPPKEENESSEDLLNSDNSIVYNPALQGGRGDCRVLVSSRCGSGCR